jgi:glycosyltransferase involved in cell wall biosynthesis
MISIIVPTFNEEGNVEALHAAVKKHMNKEPYELLFVNDGSGDGTLAALKKLAKKHREVKYVSFSRNFGHQAALRAGLRYAQGDAVISMDCDLQHPPELLPTLIKKWREGFEIVYTRRDDTQAEEISLFKKVSSRGFYGVMNAMSGLGIDPGAADFRLLDRKVVDVVNDSPEPDLFLRGLVNWVGFKAVAIDYVPAKRFAGVSKYSLKKMVKFALNGIMQFSVKPLRISIVAGMLTALGGFIYLLYVLWGYFVVHQTVEGWASTIIVILLTGGIQMMMLGIVGEYVGKTFIQTKQRPDYIVSETNLDMRP